MQHVILKEPERDAEHAHHEHSFQKNFAGRYRRRHFVGGILFNHPC